MLIKYFSKDEPNLEQEFNDLKKEYKKLQKKVIKFQEERDKKVSFKKNDSAKKPTIFENARNKVVKAS